MSEAKETVLARIRSVAQPEFSSLDRAPAAHSVRSRHEIIEQFVEYAADYKANVVRTASPELPSVVGDLMAARSSTRVVVPPDLPCEQILGDFEAVADSGFDGRALDHFHASVTFCALGIAETGTIVLDGGEGQGRRALTLVPDHHICVIFEDQIVDSVAEAVAHLSGSVSNGRPLTFISGPSATSDIELIRVEGVHGARNLDIVVTQRVTAVRFA